jgi:hypothetical protein
MERKPVNSPSASYNWQSTWPAPAKLNLFLHVVGRRADGYHLLQTVFRFHRSRRPVAFQPPSVLFAPRLNANPF